MTFNAVLFQPLATIQGNQSLTAGSIYWTGTVANQQKMEPVLLGERDFSVR